MGMSEEERVRLSARRIGMNLPVEYDSEKKEWLEGKDGNEKLIWWTWKDGTLAGYKFTGLRWMNGMKEGAVLRVVDTFEKSVCEIASPCLESAWYWLDHLQELERM
jgi:hypothetical protein